ncbi:MAG: hypothetical protein D6736_13855 [Nitrospinota bacterium]|nr:MAG: hypothetical protein D6736_13855 [Nitrospinota bacterium]
MPKKAERGYATLTNDQKVVLIEKLVFAYEEHSIDAETALRWIQDVLENRAATAEVREFLEQQLLLPL